MTMIQKVPLETSLFLERMKKLVKVILIIPVNQLYQSAVGVTRKRMENEKVV